MPTSKKQKKKQLRRELLEKTIEKIFDLHTLLFQETEKNIYFERVPYPHDATKAIFDSFFKEVSIIKPYPYKSFPNDRLEFEVSTKINDDLEAETFRANESLPLIQVRKCDLYSFYELLKDLRKDIKENNEIELRIIGRVVEERDEPFDISPNYPWLAPAYYKKAESYILKPSDTGFGSALYSFFGKSEKKQSIVPSAFNGLWTDFSVFIASIFISYLALRKKAFSYFIICEQCGKLHLAKRVDDDRGIYCSEKCRNRSWVTDSIHRCYRRQRRFISYRSEKIDEWILKIGKEKRPENSAPSYPRLHKICRNQKCVTKCEETKGGQCENFFEANENFLATYDSMKMEIKKLGIK